MSIGGSKERKSGDKSLHGLMVALAMAGTIAGSAILFAYAASGSPAPDTETQAAASTQEPEPKVVEKVVEKPVYIEKVKYINRTIEVEKPVYINRTVEVEKPVYVNRTVEVPVYIDRPVYVNDPKGDQEERPSAVQEKEELLDVAVQKPEEGDSPDGESGIITKSLHELLDGIGDFDDDHDDGKKGKGHGHKGD